MEVRHAAARRLEHGLATTTGALSATTGGMSARAAAGSRAAGEQSSGRVEIHRVSAALSPLFGRITPLHIISALLAKLRSRCNPRATFVMAVAANTEGQAAQVQAAQAAGFGPHMPLQITGVKQTPELNGLLCQMEDLRNHPVFPATLSSAPVPCLMRACRPAIPSRVLSHLAEAQGLAGPHPRAHH